MARAHAPLCCVVLLALLPVAAACDEGDDPGRPGALDGNVIVWDGARDGGVPPVPDDSGALDASEAEDDAGVLDTSTPDADAAVDPCLAAPVASVEVGAAIDDLSLVGEVIEVVGRLESTASVCTPEACPSETPCCQTCARELHLDGRLPLTVSACRAAPVGCSGSNCGTTCSPPLLGGEIRVVGRLVSGDHGPVLQVWSVQR